MMQEWAEKNQERLVFGPKTSNHSLHQIKRAFETRKTKAKVFLATAQPVTAYSGVASEVKSYNKYKAIRLRIVAKVEL